MNSSVKFKSKSEVAGIPDARFTRAVIWPWIESHRHTDLPFDALDLAQYLMIRHMRSVSSAVPALARNRVSSTLVFVTYLRSIAVESIGAKLGAMAQAQAPTDAQIVGIVQTAVRVVFREDQHEGGQ
jgi:hypothetical protein